MIRTVFEGAPRVDELRNGVPEQVEDLLARMLSRDRDKRLLTVFAVRREL